MTRADRVMDLDVHQVAFSFGAIGTLAALGGLLLPGSRTVLFALGGTGLYAGVLLPYLAAETTVPSSAVEGVYDTLVEDVATLGRDLDLGGAGIYTPSDPAVGTNPNANTDFDGAEDRSDRSASLVVARGADSAIVGEADIDSLLTTANERGVSLSPTGAPLVAEFERSLPGALADDPEELLTQLLDGLTKRFELIEHATMAVDRADSRARVEVPEGICGPVDRFDHPVVSFLGVGLATGLGTPVSVRATETDAGQAAYRIVCTW